VTQLPGICATEIEKKIAENVLPFIKDGDVLQLGIGGIPNYVASHLLDRKNLKIHSEMLTDTMVDLVNAGAINSHGKDFMDGYIVGSFAAGTENSMTGSIGIRKLSCSLSELQMIPESSA